MVCFRLMLIYQGLVHGGGSVAAFRGAEVSLSLSPGAFSAVDSYRATFVNSPV